MKKQLRSESGRKKRAFIGYRTSSVLAAVILEERLGKSKVANNDPGVCCNEKLFL